MPYLKVISTGHILEVFKAEKDLLIGGRGSPVKDSEKILDWETDFPKTPEQIKRSNSARTRNMVRRLCLSNFNHNSKFITLTFKNNVNDLSFANLAFKNFILRLRRKYGKFKYIAVIEFQKRGAIHYHVMSDLPYIKKSMLGEIWGHGFVHVNAIDHVDNVGAYMVKYMLKDTDDFRLFGRKAYLSSHNLERPKEFRGVDAQRIIDIYSLDEKDVVFTNNYESEYLGIVTYCEYNLKRS